MSSVLEILLIWAEGQLPESKRMWISDLRSEAKHIPGTLARQRFLWSGAAAAIGQLMRLKFGVQRVGQTLLGVALLMFCLGGLYMAPTIENNIVRISFYSVLPIYGLTAALFLFNLHLMKRFAVGCIGLLGLFWSVSGLDYFTAMGIPVHFFRAFAVEVAFVMTVLFIAASYLGWAEEAGDSQSL